MDGTTTDVVSASKEEVTTTVSTSTTSEMRRKEIARAGYKSARRASIAILKSNSCPRDPSSKGLRDESQAAVAGEKARKDLKKAVDILDRSDEGNHTESVHLVK